MHALPQGFYPNYPLEIDWLQVVLWLCVAVVIIVACYNVYQYLIQKLKKIPKVVTPEKKRSLWQETLNLFTQDIPADIKKYYFDTSEALSAYLGFGELTVTEIRRESFAESVTLLQVLELAELVKFAKYVPTVEETVQYRQWAITVLQAYQPMEAPHA